jgi:large subunit ribosomal protein L22
MSPEREIDETKGANPDEKIVQQAAEAKAEQEAKRPRRRRRRKTEDSEVEAVAEEQAKPRRRRTRRRKADEEEADAAEPTAEEVEAEAPEAEEVEAEAPEAEEVEAEAPEADEEEPDEAAEKPADTEEESEEGEAEEPVAADDDVEEESPAPAATRPVPEAGPVAVRARARYVRTSARKARLVCDHIRGKSVPEARAILGFTSRAAARDWSKVLESAVANAEANHELVGDELRVTEAYADEGPTLKRYRPRAMGRATRIRKRTSHLTITLAPAANESKERSR